MEVLNSLATILPNLGCVIGRVTFSGGTPSLSALTGEAISDQAQVSVTDTATGVTTITVQNALAGAQVMVVTAVIPVTTGAIFAASNGTYSGNAGSVIVGTYTPAQVAADVDFTFQINFY